MSDIALKKDIARTLGSLNTMYFAGTDNPYMGGTSYAVASGTTDLSIFPNTQFNSKLNLTHYLFGPQYTYDSKATPNPNVFKTNPVSTASQIAIVKKDNPTYYQKRVIGVWSSVYDKVAEPSLTDEIIDINVMDLMSDATEKELMNALYALHDLMSDKNWETFKSKVEDGTHNTMLLKIGTLDASENNWVNKRVALNSTGTDGANLGHLLGSGYLTLLINLADNDKFVPFAFRRVLYLYIRAFQFNIALSVLNKATGNDVIPSSELAQSIFALLESDLIMLKDETVVRMSQGVANRIKRYNNFTTDINTLNDQYSETKDYVKVNSERYDSETRYEKKASAIVYVAAVVLIVSLIVSFVSVGLDMDVKQKLMISAGGVAFASITGLILFVVFTKQVVEGFAVTARGAFATGRFNRQMTEAAKSSSTVQYKEAILELSRDYLQYITTLIQTITSYKSFGNVTYTMAKEYRYFLDNNKTLRNTGDKYRVAHRASDLYQKKHGATVYLCVVLAIACSLIAIAYIWVGQNAPFLQPFILGVGGLFIFVVLVIYILEITGYVRTDGDKKYWGKPSTQTI